MNPKVKEIAEKALREGIYKKNIHYIFRPGANIDEFQIAKLLGGSPGQAGWLIQQAQMRHGIQLHVSKQVTNDLLATDFSEAAKMENVPWPAQTAEIYFEDPLLPTILVMKCHPDDLRKWFPQLEVGLEAEEYITALMQEGSDVLTGKQLNLQLKPSMYDKFLHDADVPAMYDLRQGMPMASSLNIQDNCILCYMFHLVLKVFAFASIPAYKPMSINRKQMTLGGKPGIKERPNRPALRVDYLPKVIRERQPAIPTGEGRDFRGRRGHIRYYKSEVFTHRKGTWDFLPPVADPKTGKYPERSIIKVRKP